MRVSADQLKDIVIAEAKQIRETLEQGKSDITKVTAKEVDADGFAQSLEKDIDHMKQLKLHEVRLKKQLRRIEEAKFVLRRRIMKKIK